MADRRASYGFDAPPALFGMGAASAVYAGMAALLARRSHPVLATIAGANAALLGTSFALFMHTTRRGKFAVWREILDELDLAGDETVLDLGCGRGAVLLAAAERLPRGNAVGVDLWRKLDQSGNAEIMTHTNAVVRGVSDRVKLRTADMSSLPLPDMSVDVVVSSLAIHNIPDQGARDAAVREAARVLRPAGKLAIADIREVPRYADQLAAVGMGDVRVRDLGWRFWYGPGFGARLVTARKPG